MVKFSMSKLKSTKKTVLLIATDVKSSRSPTFKVILINSSLFESKIKLLNIGIILMELFLNFQRVPKVSAAIKKVTLRTLKLLFWGIILQGINYKFCKLLLIK